METPAAGSALTTRHDASCGIGTEPTAEMVSVLRPRLRDAELGSAEPPWPSRAALWTPSSAPPPPPPPQHPAVVSTCSCVE
eukprot:350740-Chlamydomonas_euryale.AAC.4